METLECVGSFDSEQPACRTCDMKYVCIKLMDLDKRVEDLEGKT